MPRLLLLLLLIILGGNVQVDAQSYEWVRGGGSTDFLSSALFDEAVYHMCSDNNGNIYSLSMVGNEPITADTFHRPSGAFGSNQNVLFTSHDCNGVMRFGKLISCNATIPYGVASDNAGHVYLALDLPHFGSGSSNWLRIGYDTIITGHQYNSIALVQYDTTGHLNWVRFVGADLLSTYTGMGGLNNYLATDGSGNAHFVTLVENGVQLTPTLTSTYGFYDNAYDVNGNLLSIKKLDLDTTLTVYGLTIDKQSNKMYAHGGRSAFFYPGTQRHSFIASLDTNRNTIWVDTFANPYYPGNIALGGIIADGFGSLYITPNAARSFVYKGDTSLNTISAGSSKIAGIMKIDTAGNVQWKNIISGNTGSNSLYKLTLLPNNKIATGGVMTNTIVNGSDTMKIYTGEGQNAYIFIVDSAGYTQTFDQLHGIGFYDKVNVCLADKIGNLYIGGKVETNIWGGSIAPYTSVGGDSDYFIMKYGVDCSCTATPVSDYSYTGTELSRSFTYTGTTTGIDSVKWYYGDGGTGTGMTAVHTYTGAGTYTTCARVYTNCGSDMRCNEVTVSCVAAVTAAFSDTGTLVRGYSYTGTTTYYDSVVWDLGDGTTDTGMHVTHTYAIADTYSVCVKVYTWCDTNTYCRDVVVVSNGVNTLAAPDYTISVYPNPATNALYVRGLGAAGSYRIVNVVGSVLQYGTLHSGSNELAITQLPAGVYVLEVTTDYGMRKVVRVVVR